MQAQSGKNVSVVDNTCQTATLQNGIWASIRCAYVVHIKSDCKSAPVAWCRGCSWKTPHWQKMNLDWRLTPRNNSFILKWLRRIILHLSLDLWTWAYNSSQRDRDKRADSLPRSKHKYLRFPKKKELPNESLGNREGAAYLTTRWSKPVRTKLCNQDTNCNSINSMFDWQMMAFQAQSLKINLRTNDLALHMQLCPVQTPILYFEVHVMCQSIPSTSVKCPSKT